MKASLENQEMQTTDQLRSQLKGLIPPRLSKEERLGLVKWLKENAKNISPFVIEEYEKHVAEISKPPDSIRRN